MPSMHLGDTTNGLISEMHGKTSTATCSSSKDSQSDALNNSKSPRMRFKDNVKNVRATKLLFFSLLMYNSIRAMTEKYYCLYYVKSLYLL